MATIIQDITSAPASDIPNGPLAKEDKSNFWRVGHKPTLIASFLYFDLAFMVWVLLGPLAPDIAITLGLTPAEKGLMVATPTLMGALLRVANGLLVDRIGPKLSGSISQVIVIVGLMFAREATPFPWRSQALWIYSQLLRWHMAEPDDDMQARAAAVFRPDIYRRALAQGDMPMPGASMKVEGSLAAPLQIGAPRGAITLGPDRFFDGRAFDPDRIEDYVAGFELPR